jgi:hypothetical protein
MYKWPVRWEKCNWICSANQAPRHQNWFTWHEHYGYKEKRRDWEVRGHCMCKEMPVIPVNKVVDPKRIIGKNGGPRRGRGTRGRWPKKRKKRGGRWPHFALESILTGSTKTIHTSGGSGRSFSRPTTSSSRRSSKPSSGSGSPCRIWSRLLERPGRTCVSGFQVCISFS